MGAHHVQGAKELYKQAGRGGHTGAVNNFGYMYLKGDGVKKDVKKAVALLEIAVQGEDVDAMENLAMT